MIGRDCVGGMKKQLDLKSKFFCFSLWRKSVICNKLTHTSQYLNGNRIQKANVKEIIKYVRCGLSLLIQCTWSMNMLIT